MNDMGLGTGASRLTIGAMLASAAWLGSGCGQELCTADALQAALDESVPGQTVEMGDCTIEGPVSVPAGVVLTGQAGSRIVTATSDDVLVRLQGGARLEHVQVESSGRAAVVVRGAATLSEVRLVVERGAGIHSVDAELTLSTVEVRGPVTEDNLLDARFVSPTAGPVGSCASDCECDDGAVDPVLSQACVAGRWRPWTATVGVYVRGGRLESDGLDIAGFASVGVYAEGAELSWESGSVRTGIGRGISLHGGSTSLTDVVVEGIHSGLDGIPSYGVVSTDDNRLTSRGLRVADGERYGLLSLGATGSHTDFEAERNGDVSLWVSGASSYRVDGSSAVREGAFAGVVMADANGELDGLEVSNTRTLRRVVGAFGAREIGDGVQVSGSRGAVSLRGLNLSGNARVGLLTELTGVTLSDIEVQSEADAYGALTGSYVAASGAFTIERPADWDAEITRSGRAEINDAAAPATLDALAEAPPDGVAGIIAPMY